MIVKKVLCPQRLRRVPEQFSWVDQRLVGDKYFQRCGAQAWALYLFLLCVGDAEGLSYYSDATAGRLLRMNVVSVDSARGELIDAGLIAYRRPLYQVLSLDVAKMGTGRRSEALSLAEILGSWSSGEKE